MEKVFASGRIRPYTKTGHPRTVDLSADLVDLLRTHIAELRERAFKDGKSMPSILFPSAAGTFIDWNNAVDAFHRMCRKAKIPRIAPYCLRHTFASLLLKAGTPITYVSAQLGHGSPSTTLRFYAKHVPEETHRFVDRLDASESVDQEKPPAAN